MLCIRGTIAMGLCPSVSVASRSSTETAKRRITQTTPHDTPGTLVFWCQRSPRKSTGVLPTRAPNTGGVVKIGDFRQITGYVSKTVKDRHIVPIKVAVLFCDGTSRYCVPENLTTGEQFFCSHNKVHCSEIQIVLSNLLYHYFFH